VVGGRDERFLLEHFSVRVLREKHTYVLLYLISLCSNLNLSEAFHSMTVVLTGKSVR